MRRIKSDIFVTFMESSFSVYLTNKSPEIVILSHSLYRGVSDEIARFTCELSGSEIIPFEPARIIPGRESKGKINVPGVCP